VANFLAPGDEMAREMIRGEVFAILRLFLQSLT
jgi:hypothetical protein